MTHTEIASILLKVQGFLESINSKETAVFQRLEFRDGIAAVRFTGRLSAEELQTRLPVAYRVQFSYSAAGSPITSVTLALGEVYRRVEIEGSDPTQVDALFALVTQELGAHSTTFGGVGFRYLLFFGLALLATLLGNCTLTFSSGRRFPTTRERIALVSASTISGVLVLINPTGEAWFPGVAIWAADTTFWGRHSALISFVGTLLAVLALVQGVYLAKRKATEGSRPEVPG